MITHGFTALSHVNQFYLPGGGGYCSFTFRAFSRHFCPKRLTISTFVRRKCNSKPLSVESGFHKNEFQAYQYARLTDC